jgi:hypothetical protein
LISQLTSPHETITSCHPGYAIPNSNRVPDGTIDLSKLNLFKGSKVFQRVGKDSLLIGFEPELKGTT